MNRHGPGTLSDTHLLEQRLDGETLPPAVIRKKAWTDKQHISLNCWDLEEFGILQTQRLPHSARDF